jgi:predicted DNA-binding protein (UPF0278 family)
MLINLLGDILFGAPAAICRQTLEGLRDIVDRKRLITEESIKEKLQEMQLRLQDSEITEEEYEEEETWLIERLKAVKEYRKETANGTTGNPG